MDNLTAPKSEQSAIFKEECVDSTVMGNDLIIDIIFDKEATPKATRYIEFVPPDAKPEVKIGFHSDGKHYELRDNFKTEKEIYRETIDEKSGDRILDRVDPQSAEYKRALEDADKLGFNTLPSCASVVDWEGNSK
ncbi:MAG: hypothetical protein K2Z81_19180 [Cyanobacteria bacterium]|nr:hypothetical protein [Cyanobacteriota bacterium]